MLPYALHGYRISMRTSMGATPYSLVYGMEAVLLVEVEIPPLRVLAEAKIDGSEWVQSRLDQLNLVDKKRPTEGDLVLKKRLPNDKDPRGKWAPNYDGPYVVKRACSRGALMLVNLEGQELKYQVNADATNDQAKVFNREIKKILQKMVNPSQNDWSQLLENALWVHKIVYRTPLGMSPYQIVFHKACHLPVEIEHQAYWAIKRCNMAYDQVGKERKLQLQELEEVHLEAYENSKIYKKKNVLLFNSRLKLIAVELRDEATNRIFKVNGHQLKPFHEGLTPMVGEVESSIRHEEVVHNPGYE
ncbi:hypothetical protein CR513_14634, partial [Mucuna pruriens]